MSSKYLNGMEKAKVNLNETSVADWKAWAEYQDAEGQACFGPDGGTLRIWKDGWVDIFDGQFARYDEVPHVTDADENAEADSSLYELYPIHHYGLTEAFFELWLCANACELADVVEGVAGTMDDLHDDLLDCVYECNDERLCADEDSIVAVG